VTQDSDDSEKQLLIRPVRGMKRDTGSDLEEDARGGQKISIILSSKA